MKASKTTKSESEKSQSEKFKSVVKEIETDGNERLFDRVLEKIAKQNNAVKK